MRHYTRRGQNVTLSMLSVAILFGCGDGDLRDKAQLVLHIQLPASFSKDRSRYERFVSRVLRLTIKVKTTQGYTAEHTIPPAQWGRAYLVGLDFPRGNDDVLEIGAEVWDRTPEGYPRSYPALSGKKKVSASEVPEDGSDLEIPIKLSLHVNDYQSWLGPLQNPAVDLIAFHRL